MDLYRYFDLFNNANLDACTHSIAVLCPELRLRLAE